MFADQVPARIERHDCIAACFQQLPERLWTAGRSGQSAADPYNRDRLGLLFPQRITLQTQLTQRQRCIAKPFSQQGLLLRHGGLGSGFFGQC